MLPLFVSLEVPELAGFWLLSFLFQLPILLFFMTDSDIIILPLERAVHSLYLAFLLAEILASFLALRVMTRKLALRFHMRQFGPVQSLEALPMHGLSYGARSVLPVMDMPQSRWDLACYGDWCILVGKNQGSGWFLTIGNVDLVDLDIIAGPTFVM